MKVKIVSGLLGAAVLAGLAFAANAQGLPPGSYRLQIWHERLAPITREVVVPAKGASVSIEMKLP